MAVDPLLVHAREFTDIETEGLTLWNELQDAGEKDLARQLLDARLMHEHYTSLLPNAVKDRSDAQLRQQAILAEISDRLTQDGRQALLDKQTADSGEGAG